MHISHSQARQQNLRELVNQKCPNSINLGDLVLMQGLPAWQGTIAKVISIDYGVVCDYDWIVKIGGEGCPCWDQELLLLPTNK